MKSETIHLKELYPFAGLDGCDPTVDIYLPFNMTEMSRQNRKRPCMIICPGGGYSFCSQREWEPVALHFLPEGFNVFVLNYSPAPHRFPTQLREVAATVDLICKNTDLWNCDTSKLAIMGFSAGGHLAAHYSVMYNCPEVTEALPESHPVNASVLCYPVITADPACGHMGSFNNLLGKTERTAEEIDYFSCDRRVTENTPPAYIWHTAADNGVPVANSFLYAEALSRCGVPFELHIFPYGGHGLSTVDEHTCDNLSPEAEYASAWLTDLKRWLKLMGISYK